MCVNQVWYADSAAGTVKYEYDNRLRQTAENYTRGSTLYWTRQSYDNIDRLVNKSFSSGETITYTFNSGGMLDSVPGYVRSLDYTALGKVANRTYNNSLTSKLAYFDDSFRLKSVDTGSLQALRYSYDSVGNVLQMNDSVNGSLWDYRYDPLDRLVNASEKGGLFQNYTYNSIGNILRVFDGVNTVNYTYGVGAGPFMALYSAAFLLFNPLSFIG